MSTTTHSVYLFKCRCCGEVYESGMAMTSVALQSVSMVMEGKETGVNTEFHGCDKQAEKLGIADLVGCRRIQ